MMGNMMIESRSPYRGARSTYAVVTGMIAIVVMLFCSVAPAFGQGTGSSVLLDLSKLRPSDEFKALVARKAEQLEPPAAFSAAMVRAGKALERAEADPNDDGAVDDYYNSLKDGLVIWFDFLEKFVADQEQANRLTRELGDQYARARTQAEESVRRYRDEAAVNQENLEQVQAALDRMTDLASQFTGNSELGVPPLGVGLDDAQASDVIRLVAAEGTLPIRRRTALAHVLKAKLASAIADYGTRELGSFKSSLGYRYALARAQLAAASSIADLHAESVQAEKLDRLAKELADGVKVFADAAPFRFPVGLLKQSHDLAIPDRPATGGASATVIYAGQLLHERAKRLGLGGVQERKHVENK